MMEEAATELERLSTLSASIADTAGAALYHPSLGGVANSVNAANVAAGIAPAVGASKLVPHEPTKEMLEAGREQWDRMGFIKDIWQAMYCAATPAPRMWIETGDFGSDEPPRLVVDTATPAPSVADAAGASKLEDREKSLRAHLPDATVDEHTAFRCGWNSALIAAGASERNELFGRVTDWVNEHRIPFDAQNELFRILSDIAKEPK